MQLPAPSPDVIYRAMEEGAVLLSMRDEVYYGLNAVGSYIWEQLPSSDRRESFDALIAALRARYPDVAEDRLRADAQALLADLVHHGLARPSHSATRADEADPAAARRLG